MPRKPTFAFLLAHPAHFFALGCGSGLAPKAPGTFGTLFAWLSFALFRPYFDELPLLGLLLAAYLAGIWFIDVTGKALGDADHGSIVWDEIVPFWLVLLMTPAGFLWQATAFALFRPYFEELPLLGLLLAAYLAGIWFIDVTGKALGDPDHGSIVWDEIVPFWLVLLMTPDTFLWQLAAFALFRYFDITKPQPARYFDEHVKNGFGVMADDLVAAGYTLLALALLRMVFA